MNIKNTIESPRSMVFAACLSTVLSLFILISLINKNPIIGDGKENLTIATNLMIHGTFSSLGGASPQPDMKREPAWPVLTASLLILTGLDHIEPEILATQNSTFFKFINATFLALLVGLVGVLAGYFSQRPLLAQGIAFIISITALTTLPRLVNYFNNDPLAMLLLTISSALTFFASRGGRYSAIALGLSLGLLALTKAQFLYISFIPIFVICIFCKKQAIYALLIFSLIVTPWVVRNTITFGEPAISKRGETVLAVRMVMVAEHRQSELSCMAFAFTHPEWRDKIGSLLKIGIEDFKEGGTCERFNREIGFDMGIEKVTADAFPSDIAATNAHDWTKAVQYFFRGYIAGGEIEANQLKLANIASLSFENVMRYIQTLPLFAWRGVSFSGFPFLGLFLSISMFSLAFTRLWPFAILGISTHVFHTLLTHNIPRYHIIELGIMIVAATYFIDKIFKLCIRVATYKKQGSPDSIFGP